LARIICACWARGKRKDELIPEVRDNFEAPASLYTSVGLLIVGLPIPDAPPTCELWRRPLYLSKDENGSPYGWWRWTYYWIYFRLLEYYKGWGRTARSYGNAVSIYVEQRRYLLLLPFNWIGHSKRFHGTTSLASLAGRSHTTSPFF